MVLLNVALIVPNTVNFYPLSELQSRKSSASTASPEKAGPQTSTDSYFQPVKQPSSKAQHGRSQSLTYAPSYGPLTAGGRIPAAIAKTPGATTDLENFFKPQKYEVTLAQKAIERNKSATSLQSLVASEYQTKSWGKADNVNQPPSLAKSPPSQSIFDDTAKDPAANQPEISRTSSRVKIARKRKQQLEYTKDNFKVQPTTLGNAGLFAALHAVADRDSPQDQFWVGTLGMPTDQLPSDVKENITERFENDHDTFLVWVSDTDMNSHYENYCKNILWPILHSQVPDVPKSKVYSDNSWKHYKKVNEAFAEAVISNYKEGDIVWIHDYHLLLVPNLIREKLPRAQIGLYIHSAFPPSEIFRCLPSRLELINGMLGANMIAFQIEDFRYQFMQTCGRLLNIEATDHGLVLEDGRFIDIFEIPMGIDISSMNQRRQLPEVKNNMQELTERFAGKHVIVSRDKLDGIHGLKHKLRGFAEFLQRYPKWEDKVVLVQIATSATQDIELRDTVNNLIMEINGDWGDLNHQPIVYLNQDIDYSQYLALMSIADCMLVTSLSEGMNLTCHEFVGSQDGESALKGYGPLVVSEFIGSAKVFGSNALLVNPWHPKGIAEALDQALSMQFEEKKLRWQNMYDLTKQYCATNWYDTFTQKLEHAWEESNARDPSKVPRFQIRELQKRYQATDKRLLLIDFEGTLTTYTTPKETVITVPQKVLAALNELVEDDRNILYIFSQHTMSDLQHMFRGSPACDAVDQPPPKLGLVAENGAFMRKPGSKDWIELAKFDTSSWRKGVMDVLTHYTTAIPGAYIREIKSGIIFSYFDAPDQPDADKKAGDLANQINEMCENLGVSATPIEKGLYVSPVDINKALAANAIEKDLFRRQPNQSPGFVFVVGDSYEDECLFDWAHKLRDGVKGLHVTTTVVGKRSTAASNAITQGPSGVLSALEKLTRAA